MAKKNYELTEAEWAIIKVVWEKQPCAAPTVQEALEDEKNWSYSTVKTMMDRMAAKGLLKTERIRNLTLYRPTVTKREAQKSEIMRTVKRAFDGAFGPLMHFLIEDQKLSAKQRQQLMEVLQKPDTQKKGGKK